MNLKGITLRGEKDTLGKFVSAYKSNADFIGIVGAESECPLKVVSITHLISYFP